MLALVPKKDSSHDIFIIFNYFRRDHASMMNVDCRERAPKIAHQAQKVGNFHQQDFGFFGGGRRRKSFTLVASGSLPLFFTANIS